MNTTALCRWLCFSTFALGAVARAVSPAEVHERLNAGVKITFIDLRPTSIFKNGHIPNAINVPAALVPAKQLPPLGRVIVYDEGLGRDTAQDAAAALNQKPGISAEVLDGGFAAWETAHSATTKPGGLTPEELPLISYDHLKRMSADQVVLVDLRKQPVQARQDASAAASPPAGPLTDLGREFPGMAVSHSAFELPQARQSATGGSVVAPLLVLIDNGDGASQAMARTLRANGI